MVFKNFFAQPKIKTLKRFFHADEKIRILDIGCGNGSPSLFKHYWPNSEYHAIDIQYYNLSASDIDQIDRMYIVEPHELYNNLELSTYNAIVLNHTIEHMPNAYEILQQLCGYLEDHGVIYIAFPSEKSLSFPTAIGTLQFCDDSTHVFVPHFREVSNILLAGGCRIKYAGQSRDKPRFILGFFMYIINIVKRIFGMKLSARGLWYFLGFESLCIGIKNVKESEK